MTSCEWQEANEIENAETLLLHDRGGVTACLDGAARGRGCEKRVRDLRRDRAHRRRGELSPEVRYADERRASPAGESGGGVTAGGARSTCRLWPPLVDVQQQDLPTVSGGVGLWTLVPDAVE